MPLENEFWAKRRADMLKSEGEEFTVLKEHKRYARINTKVFRPIGHFIKRSG
jgi:hypothetical protein